MIAFGQVFPRRGFHHVSWDLPNVNLVGLGAMQMADKGFSHGLGHGPACAWLELLPLRARSMGQLLANTPPISTTSRSPAIGILATTPLKTRCICGVLSFPKDFVTNYEAEVPTAKVAAELVAAS